LPDEVFLDFRSAGKNRSALAGNDAAADLCDDGLSKMRIPQMKWRGSGRQRSREVEKKGVEKLEVIADTYLSPNAPCNWHAKFSGEARRFRSNYVRA